MTQFALAKAGSTLDGLKSIEQLQDNSLTTAANKLFPNTPFNEIYAIVISDKDIDSLMLTAQRDLIANRGFKDTKLYKTINRLLSNVDELVFWYGSDCNELENIYDVSVLLNKLEAATSDSCCEAYFHFKKLNENPGKLRVSKSQSVK